MTSSVSKEKINDYDGFVEKFKPKKTTDDCYTPPKVYEIIKEWAVKEYSLQEREIVRPFYPGGDYENYKYPKNSVVIDNPPFSILSKIKNFYIEKDIRFFLFAPHLTLFGIKNCSYIVTGSAIIYENGAMVNTSFITNLEDCQIYVASDLANEIKAVQGDNKKRM